MPEGQLDYSSGLPDSARILVTGGSGFIGTNLVSAYRAAGVEVANLDISPPRNAADRDVWSKVDLARENELREAVQSFAPTHVVHLGARTDLYGHALSDYAANVEGTASLLSVLGDMTPRPLRVMVTSSRMVCRIGYQPVSDEDYCPSTIYGESKVETERLARAADDLPCVIARPTSIWGPWFEVPYRDFFLSIAKRRYVHPVGRRIEKHFGYVGNTVWQFHALMTAPEEQVLGRTFYLADDPPIEVLDLANRISRTMGRPKPREVPFAVLRALARAGDLFERTTGRRAPLTSFRLSNLITPMYYDLGPLTEVAGPPPFGLEASVPATIEWMRSQGLVS